jgi:hypothetical protein
MECRQAFVYGQFFAGPDKTLNLRWGRQVLQWVAMALHTGGINYVLVWERAALGLMLF